MMTDKQLDALAELIGGVLGISIIGIPCVISFWYVAIITHKPLWFVVLGMAVAITEASLWDAAKQYKKVK